MRWHSVLCHALLPAHDCLHLPPSRGAHNNSLPWKLPLADLWHHKFVFGSHAMQKVGGERGRRKHSELDCVFYFTACLWCAYEVRLAHAHAIYYRTNPCVIANVLGVPTENMKGNTCVFHTRFTIHPSGHAAILGTQSVASQTGVATPPECNQHHQWPQWSGTVRGSADNTWLTVLARATRRNRKCPHH